MGILDDDPVLLWCQKGTSDKIWGCVTFETILGSRNLIFWGPRTKKLQFKTSSMSRYDRNMLIAVKRKKGYKNVDFNNIYMPIDLLEKIEKQKVWALLKA
jgi:hypothetical protein